MHGATWGKVDGGVYTTYLGEDGEETTRVALGPGNGVCPGCNGACQVEMRGEAHRDYDEPNYFDTCPTCGGSGEDLPEVAIDLDPDDDLPEGFRWATREEMDERLAELADARGRG